MGTELRPGITLLQQELEWIPKSSHFGACWRASAFRAYTTSCVGQDLPSPAGSCSTEPSSWLSGHHQRSCFKY